LDRPQEASLAFRRALVLAPGHDDALLNFAAHHEDAGRLKHAMQLLDRAVIVRPDFAKAYCHIGNVLFAQGDIAAAASAYATSLAIKSDDTDTLSNLGATLRTQGKLEAAIAQYRKGLVVRPDMPELLANFANTRQEQGLLDDALLFNRRALAVQPDFATAHSNLLFLLGYGCLLAALGLRQAHEQWYEQHCPKAHFTGHANINHPGRTLRIGYVSGDFRTHAVSMFIEPVLRAHDRETVETFCYSNSSQHDAVTTRLQDLTDGWRSICGKSDAEAARMIEADGIDILVDLSGHTALNRLKLFALKPAPVQVTYLGYFATTGVPTIDYWVTDDILHPADTIEQTTEQIWRLPRCWVCYQPHPEAPEVVVPSSDVITFGSFNALAKITPQTVSLWSKVLLAVPNSRLLLKTRGMADRSAQKRLLALFAELAVPADRIGFHGHVASFVDHLAAYGEIDICLDPLPCSGGTTTADALWMGVPVLTLAGATMIGRMSASMLTALGMTEWIATNETDFVAKAMRFAADSELRARLRKTQRQRMQASALCDPAGLAGALEDAYRAMWKKWCGRNSAPAQNERRLAVEEQTR